MWSISSTRQDKLSYLLKKKNHKKDLGTHIPVTSHLRLLNQSDVIIKSPAELLAMTKELVLHQLPDEVRGEKPMSPDHARCPAFLAPWMYLGSPQLSRAKLR